MRLFDRVYLTRCCTGISELKQSPMDIAEGADPRFCWNYPACGAFIGTVTKDGCSLTDENAAKKVYLWLTPIAQLYVERMDNYSVRDRKFDQFDVSRRSRNRQGTRFTMRGIDSDGNVANFVETEQICLCHDGGQSSIVQIRGSIPIYWCLAVSMNYALKV